MELTQLFWKRAFFLIAILISLRPKGKHIHMNVKYGVQQY